MINLTEVRFVAITKNVIVSIEVVNLIVVKEFDLPHLVVMNN